MNTGCFKGKPRKRMFRFTAKKDITMLKVALDYRPWDFGSKQWKIIAEKLRLEAGYDVTPRTCRLRTEYLIEQYKKHDMKCVRKNGLEEDNNYREVLLEEIRRIMSGEQLPHHHVTKIEETSNTSDAYDLVPTSFNVDLSNCESCPIAIPKPASPTNITNCPEFVASVNYNSDVENNRTHQIVSSETMTQNGDESHNTSDNDIPDGEASSPKKKKFSHLEFMKAILELEKCRDGIANENYQRELDLREKELILKERELTLQEKRLEAQIAENQKRWENEKQRLEMDKERQKLEYDRSQGERENMKAMLDLVKSLVNKK